MELQDPTSPCADVHTYSVRRTGRPFAPDYNVYFERDDGVPVSPFHDIPLYHDKDKGILNMVVEVPRWTNAKFEISRSNFLNPIRQDVLDGEPRFVSNFFPYNGYIWNYGAFPQTWEDPHHENPDTHSKGDNDPLDACEIGRAVAQTGDVKQVKALGILGLLDEGETDWKVLVVDVHDPLADKLNDIDDVERHLPGLLDATRDWFRVYQIPDGLDPNRYAFKGRFRDREYAHGIITECACAWERLVHGKVDRGDIALANTTLSGTPGKMKPHDVHLPPDQELPPAPINKDLDEWFYIDRGELDRGGACNSLSSASKIEIAMSFTDGR